MLNPLPAPVIFNGNSGGANPFRQGQTLNAPTTAREISEKTPQGKSTALTEKLNSSSPKIDSVDIFQKTSAEAFVRSIISSAIQADGGSENSLKLSINFKFKTKAVRSVSVAEDTKTTENNEEIRVKKRKVSREFRRSFRSTFQVRQSFTDRNRQVNLFFKQTERFSSKIRSVRTEDFNSVRTKVAASFRYNLDLDFSFLKQFQSQSQELDIRNNGELQNYLNATDRLLDTSTRVTKSFFNTVDSILASTKDRLVASVSTFFDELRNALGSNPDSIDKDEELILTSINSFFDNVHERLDEAENNAVSITGKPVEQIAGDVTEEIAAPPSPQKDVPGGVPAEEIASESVIDTVV